MSISGMRPLFSVALLSLLAATVVSTAILAQEVSRKDNVVLLNQGWSQDDRLRFYFTSQGTALFPYSWFLHLEEAGSTELFRSDRVAMSYGLIPHAADRKYNPDGLPIGLTKTSVPDGRWRGDWIGIGCAACHNAELHYKGAKVRIDGGSAVSFDYIAFVRGLDEALTATAANPGKFARFADKLNIKLAPGKTELRKQLQEVVAAVHYYSSTTAATAVPFGPGRIDALGHIHNQLLDRVLQIPENYEATLAPAKPPFVWNASQSSWVQWTGFGSDPLMRNAKEAMGVFIKMDWTSKTPEDGLFDSTLDVKRLIEIEELLRKLAPPKWPEQVFGAIDKQKAQAGAKLFAENCLECHTRWPYRWSEPKLKGKRFIENALVPHAVVDTDPMQIVSATFDPRPKKLTGAASPYLAPPNRGAALASYGAITVAMIARTMDKALAKAGLTPDQLEDASGFRLPDEKRPVQPIYKAGPREGVWATGPFLHNGSVPNLYEMLLPARERSKTFLIGRDFDPVKVGVDTSGASGKFLFDTTLIGNSNKGHSFEDGPRVAGVIGRALTEAERWELVEYLKSIPDQDAQVAPFGGPKNPIKAWEDPTFFNYKHKDAYGGN